MAPPSAIQPSEVVDAASVPTNGHDKAGKATHESGHTEHQAKPSSMTFPSAPKFEDKYQERQYQKERLALAFRIFAKLGFDEGVAGHITLRVRLVWSLEHERRYPTGDRTLLMSG